jgi:hypothetical protein
MIFYIKINGKKAISDLNDKKKTIFFIMDEK